MRPRFPPTPFPRAAGSNPSSVAIDPAGRFVYVANPGSNDLSAYRLDAASGALTILGKVPAGGGANSVAVDPSGLYVYAANVFSNDVTTYRINTSSGVLTRVDTVPAEIAPYSVTTTGTWQ